MFMSVGVFLVGFVLYCFVCLYRCFFVARNTITACLCFSWKCLKIMLNTSKRFDKPLGYI